ncbi:MAG: hypothetical protein R2713_16230 [Ilumatobacteraceae bacterium]
MGTLSRRDVLRWGLLGGGAAPIAAWLSGCAPDDTTAPATTERDVHVRPRHRRTDDRRTEHLHGDDDGPRQRRPPPRRSTRPGRGGCRATSRR